MWIILKKHVVKQVILLGLLTGMAYAEEIVLGYVKVVEGEASIINAGLSVPAQPGAPIYQGNKIKTGDNARLGLTFKDNTVLSFGPNTEISIDEYLYAPAQGELKLVATLLKGTLHYISGVIAKLRPEAVTVNTPVGIIGVRGTRFLVKAEAE